MLGLRRREDDDYPELGHPVVEKGFREQWEADQHGGYPTCQPNKYGEHLWSDDDDAEVCSEDDQEDDLVQNLIKHFSLRATATLK